MLLAHIFELIASLNYVNTVIWILSFSLPECETLCLYFIQVKFLFFFLFSGLNTAVSRPSSSSSSSFVYAPTELQNFSIWLSDSVAQPPILCSSRKTSFHYNNSIIISLSSSCSTTHLKSLPPFAPPHLHHVIQSSTDNNGRSSIYNVIIWSSITIIINDAYSFDTVSWRVFRDTVTMVVSCIVRKK